MLNGEHTPVLDLKKEHTLYYRPFAPLENVAVVTNSIESLIENGRYTEARQTSADLINTTLEGLRYLETSVNPCYLCVL